MQDQFGLPPIKRPAVPRPVVVDGMRYGIRISHPARGRTHGAVLAHDVRTGQLRWSVFLFEDITSDDDGPIAPPRHFVSLRHRGNMLVVNTSSGSQFVISLTDKLVS